MPFQKGKSGNPSGRPAGTQNRPKNIKVRAVYEDLIGSFKSGNCYVYYHIDVNTKEVLYIGKGKNDRAWNFSPNARNTLWSDYVANNIVEVKIIAANLSEDEALAIERALIEVKNPRLNLQYCEPFNQLF